MDFKGFNKTWEATSFAFKISMISNAALSVCLVMSVGALAQNKERILIVPPHIPKGMEVSWTAATPEYYKSIAAWLAGVIGGTSVDNLEFTGTVLERYFSPSIRDELRIRLSRIAKDPMRTMAGAIVWFEGKEITWEQATSKVFVRGMLVTVQAGAPNPVKTDATYEFTMSMKDGVPFVTGFNSYAGEPRTKEWLESPDHLGIANDRRDAERQAEEARNAAESEDAHLADKGI